MEILKHEGVSILDGAPGRGSGRYELGSGKDPYQNSMSFVDRYNELKKSGKTDVEIAKSMHMSTTELRDMLSVSKDYIKMGQYLKAKHLKEDKQWSLQAIAKELGYSNASSVANLLKTNEDKINNKSKATADYLKSEVDKKGIVSVGIGTPELLGITEQKLTKALLRLKLEGYNVITTKVPQATNPAGKKTTMRLLMTPDKTYKDAYNFDNIQFLDGAITSPNNGGTFKERISYPKSIDSKRVYIRYAEDGGTKSDGLIQIRRGVKDLQLYDDESKTGGLYAQVRILVDGTHYLKGMAIESDDIPKGYDIVFNTNKSKNVPMIDNTSEKKDRCVLKPIKKEDPKNPFNSIIDHQNHYVDKDGKLQQGAINITRMEGDWQKWSKNLPTQFAAKQSKSLLEQQIKVTKEVLQNEYESIMAVNNPVIKKRLMEEFASKLDGKSVDLKLMAFPNQKVQVLLPIESLKNTECYAPNYQNGTKLALIRYPHSGKFEIPIVTVNNRNKEGSTKITNTAKDAIGINGETAKILSGADFDGDTVVAIPITPKSNIKNEKPLEGLKNFDPELEYPERKGMKYMTDAKMQTEMGTVSNLIMDMTLQGGASAEEMTRAVKHSMVVIDAKKHKYDWKLSEMDNRIDELKRKYQKHANDDGYGGASTLITKAKSKVYLQKEVHKHIDKNTGEVIRVNEKRTYIDKKTGKEKEYRTTYPKMLLTKDARDLISKYRTPQEIAYADYANYLKSFANNVRKEMYTFSTASPDNKEAKVKYAKEVEDLKAKYVKNQLNKPKETAAQVLVASRYKAIYKNNREILDNDKDLRMKIKTNLIKQARLETGADSKGCKIIPTDKEWEAIQAGAVSGTFLKKLVEKTDSEALKKLATPKDYNTELSKARQNRIKSLASRGYTNAEIANLLGISPTTVSKYLN